MIREIRRYYLTEKVNINNRSLFFSCEARERIERLREKIKEMLGWSGNLSFVPNEYIARKILEENGFFDFPVYSGIKNRDCLNEVFVVNVMQGITLLCYMGKLTPHYVSSSSISEIDGYNLVFSTTQRALEIGTTNTPLLLALESKISNGYHEKT